MEKKKYIAIIVILISLLYLTGCASIDYRTGRPAYHVSPGTYPGVRNDIAQLSRGGSDSMGMVPGWVYNTVAIIDLPFSFILDTLCLPYDISHVDRQNCEINCRANQDSILYYCSEKSQRSSLNDKAFIDFRSSLGASGQLFKHPKGWDWNDYYDYKKCELDCKKACNF